MQPFILISACAACACHGWRVQSLHDKFQSRRLLEHRNESVSNVQAHAEVNQAAGRGGVEGLLVANAHASAYNPPAHTLGTGRIPLSAPASNQDISALRLQVQKNSLNKHTPVLSASSESTPSGAKFPSHVSSFAVKPVPVRWSADFPEVTTLAVSSDPDVDGFLSSELRAQSELDDSHGVLGNWPSARVVAMQLAALEPACRRRVLELGAGAGLPSLVAALTLSGVERVLATDIEPYALDLLTAAHSAQASATAVAKLETRELDVCNLDAAKAVLDDTGGFDVIVVADMLYNRDVAIALGTLLGGVVATRPAQTKPPPRLVLCDSVRLVREDFVEAFRSASGHQDAAFVDVDAPVLDSTGTVTDLFISQEQPRVSMLRWQDDDVDRTQ